ncbi:hypothetical protein FF38_08094 [Lucilia cuprina]|uniref:Uncharacterized protein n=1 Tax=Lucilia cuprina TaxID=7375 RepID=A0A0L0BYR6_LUCCU|nr:hypothetical protein FF38_08094 [Lucilia cuprina]
MFVQITTKTYQYSRSLEEQMSKLISFINSKYGDIHYTPIIHFTKHMKQREYFALLMNASVGFFMPTREGSSSAALEYILCQQNRKGSRTVMVLSEFMGITDLLAQGCMLANPFDPIQVSYVLNRALLKSTAKEGSEEQERLFKTATNKYDVREFVTNILSNLVNHDLKHENQHYTPAADFAEVTSVFKKAGKRLLLLDYDGTLTPIVKDPAAAVPSSRLKQVLAKLSEDPNTSVWVISGRDMKFLDEHLSMFKINMSAEHGCYLKREYQTPEEPWENLVEQLDMSWMKVVKNVLQSYTERTEGSNIEVKKSAICWHYRRSDPIFGAFQASHLRAYLELTVSKKFPIDVLNGKSVVEIRPKLFNKGEIVKNIFKEAHEHNDFPEFVMSIDRAIARQNKFGKTTKKERVYTDKELGIPKLNTSLDPVGVKVKGKKGKKFVNDTSMQIILAEVMQQSNETHASKIEKARQLEAIREAKRKEIEEKEQQTKQKLENKKKELKKKKKPVGKGEPESEPEPKSKPNFKKSGSKKRVSFA